MSSGNDSIAPRICILGYGRLAEALTERLGQACSRISVYARRPPQESANNVHFFFAMYGRRLRAPDGFLL